MRVCIADHLYRNFVKLVGVSPYKWKRNAEDYGVRLLDYKITALKGW